MTTGYSRHLYLELFVPVYKKHFNILIYSFMVNTFMPNFVYFFQINQRCWTVIYTSGRLV